MRCWTGLASCSASRSSCMLQTRGWVASVPSCEPRGMLAAAEVLYPGPVIKPKSTRRKVLRSQRNTFQGYSTGQEHDCSTQHRSGRMEGGRGRSQQESLGLGSAPTPSGHWRGRYIEREEGRQQRGSGEGKRRDVTLAPAYLPLLSPGPAVATDSSCPSWPLARQLAPLLTPEPQTDGAPDTR